MAFEIPAVIKEHPYVSGVTVFLVGIFVLYELGWFGGSSGGTTGGDPTLTAYYQAESAAQQSGNALAIAQDQNATAVNLAQVSTKRSSLEGRARRRTSTTRTSPGQCRLSDRRVARFWA